MLCVVFTADADPSLGISFGPPLRLYQHPDAAFVSCSPQELYSSPDFNFQLSSMEPGD